MVGTPGALLSAQQEVLRMAELAASMVDQAVSAFVQGDLSCCARSSSGKKWLISWKRPLRAFWPRLTSSPWMCRKQGVVNLMHVVNDVERIGDHAINISELAELRVSEHLELSEAAQRIYSSSTLK